MGHRPTGAEEVTVGKLEGRVQKSVDFALRKGWAFDDRCDDRQQQLVDWQKPNSGDIDGHLGVCRFACRRSRN